MFTWQPKIDVLCCLSSGTTSSMTELPEFCGHDYVSS